MDKLDIPRDRKFAELELEQFNNFNFSIYVLDFNWNYLFVNDFVKKNLGEKALNLTGKNIWATFQELSEDHAFMQMKQDAEKKKAVNFYTTSPITGQRINVVGYPLKDCYLFYSSVLPNKEELLSELRNSISKRMN